MAYVADGLRVVAAGSCYRHDVLLECQTAVKHDTERLQILGHRHRYSCTICLYLATQKRVHNIQQASIAKVMVKAMSICIAPGGLV